MTSWMAKYDAIMKGEQNKIVLGTRDFPAVSAA